MKAIYPTLFLIVAIIGVPSIVSLMLYAVCRYEEKKD